MAQTTGAMSGVDLLIQFTNDGTNWTEIGGSANSIALSGFNRQSGEAYTADGDHPVVGKGKREPIEITINAVYTETAAETFVYHWTEFDNDNGDDVKVRWNYQTGGSTYTSTSGVILSCLPPNAEAAPGEPLMASATIKCSSIDKS